MIELGVTPNELRVDEKTQLEVGLVNRSQTACWMVVVEVHLPPSFSLLCGEPLLEVPRIGPGERAEMELTVCARREGEWELIASDLSFHTEDGRLERVTDHRYPVRVLPRVVRSVAPPPRLSLRLATREVPFDEWTNLEGTVGHEGGAPIERLSVKLSGPIQIDRDPPWQAKGGLASEDQASFCIPVRVLEPGRHVPLHVSAGWSDTEGRSGVHREMFLVRARGSRAADSGPEDAIPILMVTANPDGDARTEEEQGALIDVLRSSKHGDRFRLSLCPAATRKRLVAMLHDVKPRIVHFSGHGTEDSVILQDEFDGDAPLESHLIAEVFRLLSDHVECVVLNSCFSAATARRVSRHIPFVVGMQEEIHVQSARSFTTGFFEALAGDNPIDQAFEWGCLRIEVELNPGMRTPILFRNGIPVEFPRAASVPVEGQHTTAGGCDEQVQVE